MRIYISIILVVFGLDFLTKQGVRSLMFLGQEIPLFPFFSLTHIGNTGVAFGLFQGRNFLLLIVGFILVSFLFYWGIKNLKVEKKMSLVFALVIGGALGNLTDRLVFGRVTDFLDFYWGTHHWPAFNVADSSICVGAGLMIWMSFMRPNDKNKGTSFRRRPESRP